MWKRRAIKKDAKQAFFANYWNCVAVGLILAFVVGAFPTLSTPSPAVEVLQQTRFLPLGNANIITDFISNLDPMGSIVNYLKENQAQQGIFASIFNNTTQVNSFSFGVLHAVNQFMFGNTVLSGVLVSLGALIMLAFWLFVGNPLRVGACRFFIENNYYQHAAKPLHILFLYRVRRLRNSVKIMFLKTLYICLWFFTIVGGFVKIYEYKMVPYILAENPGISAKDAFALSKLMMDGSKWHAFVLDLSFLWQRVLSLLTLGIVGYVFLNPYIWQTDARLYLTLRSKLPAESFMLLRAENSLPTPKTLTFPTPVYLVQMPPYKNPVHINGAVTVRYSVLNLVLFFFTFCIIGWIWEVLTTILLKGVLVNRGVLYGPWLPIYGVGGVSVVIWFRRFAKRPVPTFLLIAVFCGVIEFFTSVLLEKLYGHRWWDYTGYFLNIDGRICLEGILIFAFAGCASIYLICPALNNFYNKIYTRVRLIIAIILLSFFLADVGISAAIPNRASLEYEPQPSQANTQSIAPTI